MYDVFVFFCQHANAGNKAFRLVTLVGSPGLMLIIYYWGPVAFTWELFHRKHLNGCPLNVFQIKKLVILCSWPYEIILAIYVDHKQCLIICMTILETNSHALLWRSSVKNSRQEPTPSNGSAPQNMAAPPARRVLGMRTRSFNKTGFHWLIDLIVMPRHMRHVATVQSRRILGKKM